jgi:hypothetical protein
MSCATASQDQTKPKAAKAKMTHGMTLCGWSLTIQTPS